MKQENESRGLPFHYFLGYFRAWCNNRAGKNIYPIKTAYLKVSIMNKLISMATFFVCLLASLLFFSCDNDDEFPRTGVPGRPSAILYEDGSRSVFSYSGQRLDQIGRPEGGGTDFEYENGELVCLSSFPPPNMADGHGSTRFEQTSDGKILVRSAGEPALDVFGLKEIELDADGFPVKITDKGYYRASYTDKKTPEGKMEYILHTEQLYPGKSYTLLSFDHATGLLRQQEEYSATDSTLQYRFTYEYDATPGIFSLMRLPNWFWGYQMYSYRMSTNLYCRQFFNYSKNLTRETIFTASDNQTQTLTYSSIYDNNGYPVVISNVSQGEEIRVVY